MNAITLFAGAGGADLGLQRAGVKHLACVEGDRNAVATLVAAGFPGIHAWIGTPPPGSDVPAWTWDGIPVDLLWGSPPCQPYSFAGDRLGADDPRDGWPATLDAIRQIRPRWVIIENVGGSPIRSWAMDLHGGMFATKEHYPYVSTRFLDAADWGLPSHRRREFLVAGPMPYRWPEPTHCGPDASVAARLRLLPWVGFGKALGIGPGATMLPGNGGHLPAPRCASEPAHTVTGSCPQYLMQPATGRRRLTWQECATLVGFPDGYPFQGTIEARYRQVGNAVAPIMAEVLARSLSTGVP